MDYDLITVIEKGRVTAKFSHMSVKSAFSFMIEMMYLAIRNARRKVSVPDFLR